MTDLIDFPKFYILMVELYKTRTQFLDIFYSTIINILGQRPQIRVYFQNHP